MNKNEIVIFDNQNIKLEVNMKDDNVWLNLDQLAQLFNRDKSVISRHIKNVLEEELKNEEVVAKFATTTKHGAIAGKTQTHQVDYYNLDVIISVGYRVKSKNGVISFDGNKRIDATLFIYFLEFIIFYIMKIDKLLIIIHLLLLHYLLQSLIQEKKYTN